MVKFCSLYKKKSKSIMLPVQISVDSWSYIYITVKFQ